MAKNKSEERFVIVATCSRRWSIVAGVYVGEKNGEIELRDVRMIAYFSTDAHTIVGAAANGPGKDALVSPRIDRARVRNVELVLDCTEKARKAIEAEPWT